VNESPRDQCPRYVRPSQGSAVRLLENFIESKLDAKRIQLVDDVFGSRITERS